MQYNYKEIAQVVMRHAFYHGATYPYISFVPTIDTVKKLANHGLMFKSFDGGFTILKGLNESVEEFDESIELFFRAEMSDSYWTNYTAISKPQMGHTLLLDSDSVSANAEVVELDERLVITSIVNEYKVANSNVEYTAQNTFTKEEIKCQKRVLTEESSVVNTAQLDEGVYQWKEQDEAPFMKLMGGSGFACRIVIAKGAVQEEKKIHQWSFPSHDVFFKYYIPSKSIQNFEGVGIVDEEEQVLFDGGESITVGTKAMECFTSLHSYVYTNSIKEVFRLKRNLGDTSKSSVTLLKQLPLPGKENLYRKDDKGNRVIELFVNM